MEKKKYPAFIPDGYVPPYLLSGCPEDAPVLLGLSGGADSASLLDMLCMTGVNVTAAHVNHCIRGAEADRDEEFCRGLAAKYGIPIEIKRIDVPREAHKSGEGLEEAARRIRYSFFAELMEERGIPQLVTAHNADDNMETVLFDLTRGSGTRGGCGIPPVRDVIRGGRSAGVAVRPILGLSKERILRYCKERGLEYVTDSTNTDTAYSRNRIRHLVIPELRVINPDVSGAFTRFSETLREDCDFLDSEAEKLLNAARRKDAYDTSVLKDAALPILSRVMLFASREQGARPERRHIIEMARMCADGRCFAAALPGSIIARREKDGMLTFVKDRREKKQRQQV